MRGNAKKEEAEAEDDDTVEEEGGTDENEVDEVVLVGRVDHDVSWFSTSSFRLMKMFGGAWSTIIEDEDKEDTVATVGVVRVILMGSSSIMCEDRPTFFTWRS